MPSGQLQAMTDYSERSAFAQPGLVFLLELIGHSAMSASTFLSRLNKRPGKLDITQELCVKNRLQWRVYSHCWVVWGCARLVHVSPVYDFCGGHWVCPLFTSLSSSRTFPCFDKSLNRVKPCFLVSFYFSQLGAQRQTESIFAPHTCAFLLKLS